METVFNAQGDDMTNDEGDLIWEELVLIPACSEVAEERLQSINRLIQNDGYYIYDTYNSGCSFLVRLRRVEDVNGDNVDE